MSTQAATSSSGIGFAGALAIAFIVLKLCHVITWPWLWVLSPLWIPLALFVGFLIVFGVIAGITWIVVATVRRRR